MIDLDKLRKRGGIIRLQGKDYVTHSGLLWLAHESGIEAIDTELVTWEPSRSAAVVRAVATGSRGRFTGYGDADPGNVGRTIASACLRMAETRAVNRALRLYTGLGMTSAEELPGPAARPMRATQADAEAPPRRAAKVRRQPDGSVRVKFRPLGAYADADEWLDSASAALSKDRAALEAALTDAGRDYRTVAPDKRPAALAWLRERL